MEGPANRGATATVAESWPGGQQQPQGVDVEVDEAVGDAQPVGQVLHLVEQENIDLVVMGGTRRGFLGRMMWPEMAYEVAWNIQVPLLIWY